MQEIESQTAILVTASAAGDDVRRDLLGRGVALAGTTASLAQLRRSLVRNSDQTPIILCITLDGPTLRRHGRALTRFLDDRASFAAPVHAIGLVFEDRTADGWARIGCDAHATSASHLVRLLRRFAPQPSAVTNRLANFDGRLSRGMLTVIDLKSSKVGIDESSPHSETRESNLRRPQS